MSKSPSRSIYNIIPNTGWISLEKSLIESPNISRNHIYIKSKRERKGKILSRIRVCIFLSMFIYVGYIYIYKYIFNLFHCLLTRHDFILYLLANVFVPVCISCNCAASCLLYCTEKILFLKILERNKCI